MLFIAEEELSVEETEEKVKGYEGDHFVQLYRVLEEACVQHHLRLDKLGMLDRSDVREARNKLSARVESILQQLKDKIHNGGVTCADCPLQEQI
jgi:hypothetical protein